MKLKWFSCLIKSTHWLNLWSLTWSAYQRHLAMEVWRVSWACSFAISSLSSQSWWFISAWVDFKVRNLRKMSFIRWNVWRYLSMWESVFDVWLWYWAIREKSTRALIHFKELQKLWCWELSGFHNTDASIAEMQWPRLCISFPCYCITLR